MTRVIEEEQDITRRGGSGPTDNGPEEDGKDRFLGLSVPQLLGGAGAAVSSAVVASYLGVAGTLSGAALGSIVSTVSAALYTDWAKSAHGRLPTAKRVAVIDASRPEGSRAPALDAGSVVITAGRAHRKRRLRRLIAGAITVFVMAVVAVTAIEVGLGHPFSNQDERGGTSIGTVVGTTKVTPSEAPSTPAKHTPSVTPTDATTSAPSDATTSNDSGATSTSTPSDSGSSTPSSAATSAGDGTTPQPQATTPAN